VGGAIRCRAVWPRIEEHPLAYGARCGYAIPSESSARSRSGLDALCFEPHRFSFSRHLNASEVASPLCAYRYGVYSSSRSSSLTITGNPVFLGEVHHDGVTHLLEMSRELDLFPIRVRLDGFCSHQHRVFHVSHPTPNGNVWTRAMCSIRLLLV
jgi:hypothetical protein